MFFNGDGMAHLNKRKMLVRMGTERAHGENNRTDKVAVMPFW